MSGGKHYGHMEVNVYLDADGLWKAKLEPVYVFPLMNTSGTITGWERRVYDDVTILTSNMANNTNQAPVLDSDGNPVLSSIEEEVLAANNPGTLVSSLISSMAPNGGISDADAGDSRGIAVIGANQNSGTWQFSTDGGSNWSNFGSTSSTMLCNWPRIRRHASVFFRTKISREKSVLPLWRGIGHREPMARNAVPLLRRTDHQLQRE